MQGRFSKDEIFLGVYGIDEAFADYSSNTDCDSVVDYTWSICESAEEGRCIFHRNDNSIDGGYDGGSCRYGHDSRNRFHGGEHDADKHECGH